MEYTSNYAALKESSGLHDEVKFDSMPSPWLLFGVLSCAYIFLSVISYVFILTDNVYVHGMEQQVTAERIEEALAMRSRYWWWLLVIPPVLVLFRSAFTGLCAAVGTIMIGQDVKYTKLFKIALLAEIVLLLQMAVQTFFGVFVLDIYVPDDFANFAPLSLYQFFDPASLKLWMKHPLKTLNLFEVAYVLLIAYFLTPLLSKKTYWQTLGLVGISYGLGLLLWIVALAFLLLQVS
jgi:hypothetical protein